MVPNSVGISGPISGRKETAEMTSIPGKMTSPRPMNRASLPPFFCSGMFLTGSSQSMSSGVSLRITWSPSSRNE